MANSKQACTFFKHTKTTVKLKITSSWKSRPSIYKITLLYPQHVFEGASKAKAKLTSKIT